MSNRFVVRRNLMVVDRETGLMWQKEASKERLMWPEGFDYIERLNAESWGGFRDWRYPTKDELASLLTEEENRETRLYIFPVFGNQRCCWSSTEMDHHRSVYVDYYYGGLYVMEQKYANYFVRAVRDM